MFRIIYDRSYSTIVRTEQLRKGDPDIYYKLGEAKRALDSHLKQGIEELREGRQRVREITLSTIETE